MTPPLRLLPLALSQSSCPESLPFQVREDNDGTCPPPPQCPSADGGVAGIRWADSFVPRWEKSGGNNLPFAPGGSRFPRGMQMLLVSPSPAFWGGEQTPPPLQPFWGQFCGWVTPCRVCPPPHPNLQHVADSAATMPPAVPITGRVGGWVGAVGGEPGMPRRGLPGAPHSFCAWALSQPPRRCPDAPALPASDRSALPGAPCPVAAGWGQPDSSHVLAMWPDWPC